MFDLYTLHVVANGVKYYKSNRAVFDEIFPAISEVMRNRLWNTLQDLNVSFDSAYSQRTAKKLPLITVESTDQLYDQQALGNESFPYTDQYGRETRVNHIFTSQQCQVNIYGESLESVRLYTRIIHASMLLFKNSLTKANYHNVLYTGSSSLIPDEQLIGEELGVYGRQLRFSALHLLQIPARIENLSNVGELDTQYTVQVIHESQTPSNSSVTGGVSV